MSGLYAADGSINVTVVDGLSYTGLYAADGSYNVVSVDGSTYTGVMAECGAYNVIPFTSGTPMLFAPCGAFYVTESPYTLGTMRVTVVSGSLSGSSPGVSTYYYLGF